MGFGELTQASLVFRLTLAQDGFALWYRCIRDRHEPLSHSGCDPGLLRRHFLAPHSPSLYTGCGYILLQRLACRQDRREVLPHHAAVVFLGRCIHHCRDDYDDWAKILRHDAHACWDLHGLRGGIGVDLEYASPTSCEGCLPSLPAE